MTQDPAIRLPRSKAALVGAGIAILMGVTMVTAVCLLPIWVFGQVVLFLAKPVIQVPR